MVSPRNSDLADRLIPRLSDWDRIGEVTGIRLKGDRDHWEQTRKVTSKLSAPELSAAIKAAYETAYAQEGPWRPGSFKAATSGPLSDAIGYDDRDGHHWKGTLTVKPASADAHYFTVRFVTSRSDA